MKPTRVLKLTDIPNVGPRIADDFVLLGIKKPKDLIGKDPFALYKKLCRVTGTRHDPCVLDTFMAVTDFMNGAPARPWWYYTKTKKRISYCIILSMQKEIRSNHKTLKKEDKEICEVLFIEITRGLPEAENKVWHAHPVWFLDGNPIVGYSKLKDSVRLMFWSGQSFKEKGLQKEGSFKAGEIRYTEIGQIHKKDLSRWLKKSKEIQWDYKNIVKRKGVLKRLK